MTGTRYMKYAPHAVFSLSYKKIMQTNYSSAIYFDETYQVQTSNGQVDELVCIAFRTIL